jgi:hypothetical protein
MPMKGKAALLLAPVVLAMTACTADFQKTNTSPVLFRIVSFDPQPLESDIAVEGVVFEDDVNVTVAVRPKNPLFDNVPQIPMAVFLERYEVRYYRSDGRNTEGVDVPYRISGDLTIVVDVGTDAAQNVTFPIEVVRRQAKLEPPLSNLTGPVPDTINGGNVILTTFAEVALYGRTVAGETVSDKRSLQINFLDTVQ